MVNIRTVVSISVIGLLMNAAVAWAQPYPTKPIRLVTTAAGGGGDFDSRQMGQGMSAAMGQPIVVDNRANGRISAEVVSKAPADGYTLLVGGASLWAAPLLQKQPYEVSDFAPISLMSRNVFVVAVNPALPAKTIKELVALAKSQPGKLNYGTAAVGGPTHISAEMFKSMAGVNFVQVPYKGQAPAITALIANEIQLLIADAGTLMPQAKSGKVRVLAVTSAEPSALTPGVPTVAASGLPGYEWVGVTGLLAPAKTPEALITRLNQEVGRALTPPDVKQRFLDVGEEIVLSTPEQFVALIKSDTAKTSKVIKDANIKVE